MSGTSVTSSRTEIGKLNRRKKTLDYYSNNRQKRYTLDNIPALPDPQLGKFPIPALESLTASDS